MNSFKMELEEKEFDITRNIYIIYDPDVEIVSTHLFSFNHDYKINNGWITLNFRKDENKNKTGNMIISKVCYVLIGYKK